MKKIELKLLDIQNFKGIESESISFSNRVQIYGRNGTGKTTIMDAFLWCLFGKDSSGSSDFSVKRKKPDGTDVHRIDVDVMCQLYVDGEIKSFRRRLVEEWTKGTGSNPSRLKGHSGEYFVNDVPVSAGDYGSAITAICPERLFHLLTWNGGFNRLKDADRRTELASLADEINDIDLATDFPNVLAALTSGKTIQQYRDEIKAKKKKIETEKAQYPARLKENADMRPKPVDFEALEKEKQGIETEIEKATKQQSIPLDGETAEERLQKQITGLDGQMAEIMTSLTKERNKKKDEDEKVVSDCEKEVRRIEQTRDRAADRRDNAKKNVDTHTAAMAKIREEWDKENSRTCEVSVDAVCPTCGKGFTEEEITEKKNEIIRNFNAEKLRRLDEIRKRGDSQDEYLRGLKDSLAESEKEVTEQTEAIQQQQEISNDAKKRIEALPSDTVLQKTSLEYCNLKEKRDKLQAQLNGLTVPDEEPSSDPLEAKRTRMVEIDAELEKKGQIERADRRREELLKREKELGQEIATYEGIENEILQFSMKKTDLIEESVSSKFRFVKFKLFEYNLTNDGVKEVCICTVNGVPYNSLNTAMQINADIDIINALSAHHGISAPLFIDRAESINQIEETPSQRIDLYATMNDYSLRIEQ